MITAQYGKDKEKMWTGTDRISHEESSTSAVVFQHTLKVVQVPLGERNINYWATLGEGSQGQEHTYFDDKGEA